MRDCDDTDDLLAVRALIAPLASLVDAARWHSRVGGAALVARRIAGIQSHPRELGVWVSVGSPPGSREAVLPPGRRTRSLQARGAVGGQSRQGAV